MYSKHNITILIIIITLFTCCNPKESFLEWQIKEASDSYRKHLGETKLSKETIDHFPDSITSLPMKAYSFFDEEKTCMYYMLFEYKIDSTLNIQNNYLAKYQPTDDNLLVLRPHKRNQFLKDYTSYSHLSMDSVSYPIPFFEKNEYDNKEDVVKTEDVYSDSTLCGLSKDFIIYIIDSKKGIYRENRTPLRYMPQGWENGYSKGICINKEKNIIIYWTLIW